MKRMSFLMIGLLLIGQSYLCSAQSADKETSVSNAKSVEVYYFHMTRRCPTCQAVGSVTKDALQEYYGSKVPFSEYNLEEENGEKKGQDLEVSGQSLLIVKGDTKINLTSEGFMYARTNPDKLKSLIKEKVDSLL